MNPKFRKFLFLCALFPNGGCAIATDYFTDAAPIWEATHSMQPRATCRTGKPCGNTCINISYTCNIGTASTSTTGITSFVPIAQTITFQSLPTISVGTNGVITANGGSSGYPVVFTSITPTICSVTGTGTVTGISAGTCTVAANQAGSTTYSAASQTLTNLSIKTPTPPAALSSTTTTAIYNRILNWAEHKFPTILIGSVGNSTLTDGTIYRCYPSNFCVGYREGRVLTFDGVKLADVGGDADFLPIIQADGF